MRWDTVHRVQSNNPMLPTESQSVSQSVIDALCRQPAHGHCRKMIEELCCVASWCESERSDVGVSE